MKNQRRPVLSMEMKHHETNNLTDMFGLNMTVVFFMSENSNYTHLSKKKQNMYAIEKIVLFKDLACTLMINRPPTTVSKFFFFSYYGHCKL